MTDTVPVLGKITTIYEHAPSTSGIPSHFVINKVVDALTSVDSADLRITAKVDGTCCLIKDGNIWARQDVKRSKTPQQIGS